jgi:hypothetical protein
MGNFNYKGTGVIVSRIDSRPLYVVSFSFELIETLLQPLDSMNGDESHHESAKYEWQHAPDNAGKKFLHHLTIPVKWIG